MELGRKRGRGHGADGTFEVEHDRREMAIRHRVVYAVK